MEPTKTVAGNNSNIPSDESGSDRKGKQGKGRHAGQSATSLAALDGQLGGEYITVKCPVKHCGNELILVCPYCHHGALQLDGSQSVLICPKCRQAVSEIRCNCGFTTKGASVLEKIHQMQKVRELCDPGAYRSMIAIFVFFALIMLLFL